MTETKLGEEIITADGKKVKLNDDHIKSLIEKGQQQNNKLCFADITDMIAGLDNFTPKDYEKVMGAVNKAHLELVDKLSDEDLAAAKAASNALPKEKPVATVAAKVAAVKKEAGASKGAEELVAAPIVFAAVDGGEEPTAEELSSIIVDADEPATDDIIDEIEAED